jgi:CheY-like chemotaxis protein
MLAVVQDLMAASRLAASARALGWTVTFAETREQFERALRDERPALVLIGLAALQLPLAELVATVRADPAAARTPVIAFGPHLDLELRQRALAAGCTAMVGNSRVATDLAGLLRQYVG